MSNLSESFKHSWYKHPILWNIVCIIVAFMVLGLLSLSFLDLWTHHGSTTVVPDVVGLQLNEGVEKLKEADLEYIVSDSVYVKDKAPGSIVDVIPQPNSVVKSGREVYVTIVAFSPETITIDMLLLDTSAKQAESYLRAKGLKFEKRYVPSDFPGLVVAAKCNGRNLIVGSKVTVKDLIVLEIGEARVPEVEEPNELDLLIGSSIDMDNGASEGEVEELEYNSASENSDI